ncbi:MAG TPA: hypothetical protein VHO84_10435 [Syntrophorhabdaceae bacterium]|nr:hypothetical protein [Syntrophorhabdaceae bacterium]
MATKKATAKKTAPKKTAAKKSSAAKPETGKAVEEGAKYACDICGLVVSVDTACGCDEVDLLCCGEPMAARA